MKNAKDLYLEAINSDDKKAKKLLIEAIELEPSFFLAKEALIELSGNKEEDYLKLLDEIDIYNKDNNITVAMGDYWTDENGNNKLSVYNRLMNIYQSKDLWNKLEETTELMIKLDNTNEFRQECFYLQSLLMQQKYDKLDPIIYNNEDKTEYLIAGFLKTILLGEFDKSVEILRKLEPINPNFAAIIFGVMIITDEDYDKIFSLVKLEKGTPEEAFYYAQVMAGAIPNVNQLFGLCLNTKFDEIKPMITAGELELVVLMILLNIKGIKKNEVICELRGIGQKKTDYYGALSKASKEDIEELIKEMIKKGLVQLNDDAGLKTTYLGYSVLQMMADSSKND